MKHRFAKLATLAMAGAMFAAPLAAHADPIATMTGTVGSSTTVGDTINVDGSQCVVDGQQTYVGLFYGVDGTTWYKGPFEEQTVAGTWHWTFPLDPATETGTVQSIVYCSTAPVSSLDDPAVQWASPVYHMTIESSPRSVHGKARAGAKAATAAMPTMTLDINALPRVDKMGLPGAQAAALKTKVDARFANVSQAYRLSQAALGGVDGTTLRASSLLLPFLGASGLSEVYTALAGGNSGSNQAFVDRVSTNILGHPADPASRTTWINQIKGNGTRAKVLLAIANSAPAVAATDNSAYVMTAELTLGKPLTSAARTQAMAAPLDSAQVARVQVVEQIAS